MTKTKNVIKTCDSFLDLCIGLKLSLLDRYELKKSVMLFMKKGEKLLFAIGVTWSI